MSRRAWIAIKKLMTKATFIATITGLVTNESNNKSFAWAKCSVNILRLLRHSSLQCMMSPRGHDITSPLWDLGRDGICFIMQCGLHENWNLVDTAFQQPFNCYTDSGCSIPHLPPQEFSTSRQRQASPIVIVACNFLALDRNNSRWKMRKVVVNWCSWNKLRTKVDPPK